MENLQNIWKILSESAWSARENAYLFGKTKVGSALLSEKNKIYTGCNVEHMFRSHDVHAEVNVISNMISAGETKFKIILVAAEREKFTPCGSCMDWIMQHGGKDCTVAYQNKRDGDIKIFKAYELMPHYPF